LALAVPLPLWAAPTKKPAKVKETAPVLVWPRISRANRTNGTHPIRAIQYLLNYRGVKVKVDGKFAAQTEAAVKRFQKTHKLKVDGVVGPQTWEELIVRLKRGDKGNAVRAVQTALNGIINDVGEHRFALKEDGVFGFETEKAVRDFQKGKPHEADGIVDPQTWCFLSLGEVMAE
jgi:peptidoglycan hydrolase-like protein with peptidoglycan-binding domain